ncbi:hypothetical protein GobsT_69640 [Gemmata obscuriglobus]|uniref:hypothetical protein n=1 Tax=Gemmata obscuriglobus TaxID=114 RepID=UPI00016C57E6
MTEVEWLVSENPDAMLNALTSPSQRKGILFACACCHRIASTLTAFGSQAIAVAERFADGHANREELLAINPSPPKITSWDYGDHIDSGAAVACAVDGGEASHRGWKRANQWAAVATTNVPAEWRTQANLLRDIFGNPFRPVTFSPSWRTGTAVALASGMYESRDFSAMPILADALQDAGCDRAEVLEHCQRDGPHVRGCWVADLVLGRE